MLPSRHFRFCPACGAPAAAAAGVSPFICHQCAFHYHFNAAVAAAVFVLRSDGQALFVRRANDPARGRLAPPGGFVDIGEPVEAAARREVREEVGLELADVTFLCSRPNEYHYKAVTYPVIDMFFVGHALDAHRARALDEVDGFVWIAPEDVSPEEIAFPSMRSALAFWREQRAAAGPRE
jgi:ADP-ribose pyrophosphatase YjhB (NUDIX family)